MSRSTEVIRRKIVITGDGACGKTSLLYVFTLGEFPTEYHPTVFDNYVTDCRVDGKAVQLALWDTAGQEEYERLRPLSYSNAHVILIGFAVDTRDSLDNIRNKWFPEAKQFAPTASVIVVGLKSDLREDSRVIADLQEKGSRFVTQSEAESLAREIGAKRYMECSALTGEGVDDIFEVATRNSLLVTKEEETNGCCVIL